ncbi:MAG: DUF1571 domain-containing protein, partial [Planctomycetota bacterium]
MPVTTPKCGLSCRKSCVLVGDGPRNHARDPASSPAAASAHGLDDVKGQEVIWVDGQNEGNMLAHAGSGVRAMVGTVTLKPDGALA